MKVVAAATATILTLLGALTHRQAAFWKDSETLFSHTLAATEERHLTYFGTGNYMAHFCLGNALIDKGNIEAGRVHLEMAKGLNPSVAFVHGALASLAVKEGKYGEAIEGYREALRHPPTSHEALNDLAWLLATCPEAKYRDGAEAVQLAERACELTRYEKTIYIGTLAAAYAEAGRFAEAISAAQRAHDRAVKWGEEKLATRNAELLELYRAGKAFHEMRSEK